MINKVLICNRGEIAVRIIKACRECGIISAAVYSEADKGALHVRVADEAYCIGPASAKESYLNHEVLIETAKNIGADAIHPGYGFLSENSTFIKKVEESGLIFIGPSSKSVLLMGDKTAARRLMKNSGVPIVPGTVEPVSSVEGIKAVIAEIGLPVMLKASAGGGGKGMRKISDESEIDDAFDRARNEALKAFGNDDVYVEKYIEDPKHIEVQILGDKYGNYVHVFERECSIQRRHQKIIEESPSPSINEKIREEMTSAAVSAAKACGYYNAGTIEFLYDKSGEFYFLEMNTRIQVEHPVTEMISGIDLVKEQLRIASGERLSVDQCDLSISGHSIECRVYAEDPDNNFAPSLGKIQHHRLPSGAGIRVDRGIDFQSEVSIYYDPLLAKLITWGINREEARQRIVRAIREYQIGGVKTNLHFCRWILTHSDFINGTFDINFLQKKSDLIESGDWKKSDINEFKEAITIFGALIKFQNEQLKPMANECKGKNRWRLDRD